MRRYAKVHAPLEVVFAAISDLLRHAEWAAHRITIEPLQPGPVKVGAEYKSTPVYASAPDHITVTELVPNKLISFRVVMPNMFEFQHTLTVSEELGTTALTRDVRATRLPGWAVLSKPIIPFISRVHEAQFLDNLKTALEQEAE